MITGETCRDKECIGVIQKTGMHEHLPESASSVFLEEL